MKYRAALPEHNDNVSHEHPLKEFFVLLAGAIGVIGVVYLMLGLFIDFAVDYVTPEMELRIFRATDMIWEESGVQKDDERRQSLQALMGEVGTCLKIAYPITVRISESEQINAFAIPGGTVIVHTALLDALASKNGLAFVLAHELGHFQNRDHLRAMGRGIVLLAIFAALSGGGTDLSDMLAPVTDYETARFSQERESEADATALRALNCLYGHIGGATELFEVIAGSGNDVDFSFTHYFSSHPAARQRIAELHRLSEQLGFSLADTLPK